MFPSITFSAIKALFSKPRMDFEVQGINLALKPTVKQETEEFLYFFLAEALSAKSDPLEALDRLIVEEIQHLKIEAPEHELLSVQTRDTLDANRRRTYILERMLAAVPTNTENTTPRNLNLNTDIYDSDEIIPGINEPSTPLTTKIYDTIKGIVDTIFSSFDSGSDSALASDLRSMEEGTSRSFSPCSSIASESLSVTDSVTVSVSESADCVSNALSDQDPTPALDRFLGQHFAGLRKWSGTKLRHFKPKRQLTFFEFVVLAHLVHLKYPQYTRLRNNCMFYATLVYDAAERYTGDANTGNNDTHSGQGRWRGLKVNRVDPYLVSRIVMGLKRALTRLFGKVSLCSCSNYSH
jgi:hypothetical protein